MMPKSLLSANQIQYNDREKNKNSIKNCVLRSKIEKVTNLTDLELP